MSREIQMLLEEAVQEGILDKLRGAIGLKEKGQYELIPKEKWESLIKENRRLVEMFANTPGIGDAYDLVQDILEALTENNCMHARKLAQNLRIATNQLKKDKSNKEAKSEIIRIIKGLQKEANLIRTVRQDRGLRRESIEDIAEAISEDIRYNNGLII